MKRIDGRLVVGVLLIAGGVFYLLDNFLNLRLGGLVWAIAATLGAVVLLAGLMRDRTAWWLVIPALALLGLAAVITLDALTPAISDQWSGPVFLGAIGLGFWIVYVLDRQMWWAIIPAGVLTTLAVVAGLEDQTGIDEGAIFFLGLALTFLLVGVIPSDRGAMRWAFFPAAALGVMGILLLIGFERAIGYLWPIALIVVGGFLLWRAAVRKS